MLALSPCVLLALASCDGVLSVRAPADSLALADGYASADGRVDALALLDSRGGELGGKDLGADSALPAADAQPRDAGSDSSSSSSPDEILVLDTDKHIDVKGHPGGVIDSTTYWPFFEIPADVPHDWTAPDNFFQGVFYARLEVKSKPNDNLTSMQVLLWQDGKKDEIGGPKFEFTTTGVYTRDRGAISWPFPGRNATNSSSEYPPWAESIAGAFSMPMYCWNSCTRRTRSIASRDAIVQR